MANNKKASISLISVILLILLNLTNTPISKAIQNNIILSQNIIVDNSGGGDYMRINDALSNANPGDTIIVRPGTYKENVWVRKTISLIGSGSNNTTIDGMGWSIVLKVSANNVNISGFKCINSGKTFYDAGLLVQAGYNNCTIFNNNFSNNYNGIMIAGSNFSKISNNQCYSNLDNGIFIYPAGGKKTLYNNISDNICKFNNNGINYSGDSSIGINFFYNNTCVGNKKNGMHITTSKNIIKNNSCLMNNLSGIYINEDYNIIENNFLLKNKNGILLLSNERNTVINNTFTSNKDCGLYLYNSKINYIQRNNFTKNNNGIYFDLTSDSNNIHENLISSNKNYGVKVDQEPKMNKIYHNNIIDNTQQCSDISTEVNYWYHPSYQEGNYWSDYNGLDNGDNDRVMGDGIGDTDIPHLGLDKYPFITNNGWLGPGIPILLNPGDFDIDGNYKISWLKTYRAIGYILEESEYESFNKSLLLYKGQNLSYQLYNKSNGIYFYRVRAYSDYEKGHWSNIINITVSQPPKNPENFTVSINPEGNEIILFWRPISTDVFQYQIELKNDTIKEWTELATINHSISKFAHKNLINGIRYYYRIRAINYFNQFSKWSEEINAIPWDSIPPMAPIELKASTILNSSIELTWDPNNESDLVGYDLYRTLDLELNFSKINIEPIINSSYLDTGLMGNTTYYYKLLAYDEVPNYSGFSNIANNTTYLTSPKIISYSPTGVDVPLNSKIEIVFTKPMSKTSVKKGLKINPDINGSIFWENDQQTMIFQPENDLLENTTYNVTLVNPILDLEGGMLLRTFSWEFTTIELPKIINYLPMGDLVNTDTNITIVFNRDMNKTSVQEAISIDPEINGTFKWINDKKLVFEPDNKLPELTTYEITIAYLAQDLIGNNLQDDFSWSFRTGDFTPPEIISYSPIGENVEVDTQISIVFSEPMNKSRVENNLIISPNIDGEIQWRGNTLVFIPDTNLKYDTKYTITLSSDAADKWGNPLADDLSWEFTTEKKKSDDEKKGINYELELIVSIILIIIILIIIFIFILMRKKRDKSDKDVLQQQDETLEE